MGVTTAGAGEAACKSPVRGSVIVRLNAAFLAFFLFAYLALLLHPKFSDILDRGATSLVRCTFRDSCPPPPPSTATATAQQLLSRKLGGGVAANKAVVAAERVVNAGRSPAMFAELRGPLRMGLVNIGRDEVAALGVEGDAVRVDFDRVAATFRWADLFPEWIDEEEDDEGPSCPELPMPDWSLYGAGAGGGEVDVVDVVVAALPCDRGKPGWNRDVFRLQVHLVAAHAAARMARRDGDGAVRVVLRSPCEPMMDLFRCDEAVGRDGDWYMYRVDVERLQEKLRLPVGSCNLAMPLWGPGGIQEAFNASSSSSPSPSWPGGGGVRRPRREAYATVLHSSDTYLCGAIVLAQSIRRSGSTRDLILLHDHTVSKPALRALAAAGWSPRRIKRIRNPRAARGSYNEYNYSKFRLWQLTDYDRVVFVDADILVLRSLDPLFAFPQLAAAGNDAHLFNSGVMVIEPSACAFSRLLRDRRAIVSYNGGDQGFLNEVFVWWHRLPRRVNYLKNFWANTTGERALKERMFRAGGDGEEEEEEAQVWSIHYLGMKPWTCYRDYDCNWNVADQRVYASDEAHRRWWQVYDQMGDAMRGPCRLSERRKVEIAWDRHVAEEIGYADQHWKINITDPRKWD